MKPAAAVFVALALLATLTTAALALPAGAAKPAAPAPLAPPHATPLPRLPVAADSLPPHHIDVESLIASMNGADSIQVGRVAIVWRDTVDLSGKKTRYPYTERLVMQRARPSWMRRFTRALLDTSTSLSDELCPPPAELPGGEQPWMTTVLWFSRASRGQAYLNFFSDCGFAGVGGRMPAGFWIDEHADTLLGMMREALPADSVIRNYRAARRAVMAAGGGEVLPKFGDNVRVDSLPTSLIKVQPVYPEAARAAGIEGTVLVQALIGRDGLVKDMKLSKGVDGLDAAALVAVRQWTFQPATLAGKPVAVWVAVPVKFSLH